MCECCRDGRKFQHFACINDGMAQSQEMPDNLNLEPGWLTDLHIVWTHQQVSPATRMNSLLSAGRLRLLSKNIADGHSDQIEALTNTENSGMPRKAA